MLCSCSGCTSMNLIGALWATIITTSTGFSSSRPAPHPEHSLLYACAQTDAFKELNRSQVGGKGKWHSAWFCFCCGSVTDRSQGSPIRLISVSAALWISTAGLCGGNQTQRCMHVCVLCRTERGAVRSDVAETWLCCELKAADCWKLD